MLNATVISRSPAGDATIYRIKPDERAPEFKPGQHLLVGAMQGGVLMMRPYSIASAPSDVAIELCIQDTLPERVQLADHATGQLTLDGVPTDRDLLMIATGTGIAPFMSMLRTFPRTHGHAQRWRSVTLVHGVRRAQDLAYRQELQARSDVTYAPVVSREPWEGAQGRVQSMLALHSRDRERTHAFVCGSNPMVAEVEQLLVGAGFSHIHLER